MTVLFLITTVVYFLAWIFAQLAMYVYKERLAAANETLARVDLELKEIKSEIEEYVLDGQDFDLIDAMLAIRHWKAFVNNAERESE